jgi:type I restriction enzyme S subunit
VLLERIAEERTQLVKMGKVREARDYGVGASISDYGQLPKTWELATVAEVTYLRSGIALERDEEKSFGDIPYLKVADLSLSANEIGITTSSRFVGKRRQSDIIPAGSIVFPKRGGAIATNRKRVSKVDIVGDSNLMAMRPYIVECLPFIEVWFSSFDLWVLNSGTSVPQINNKDIYPLSIPLPPLAEQHRIVAKVDALTALCDQLETALTTSATTRSRLLDTLIRTALSPDVPIPEAAE